MGFFDKMQNVALTGRGVFIPPGLGELEIAEIKVFQGQSGLTFVCEFLVREFQADETAIAEQIRQKEVNSGPYAHPKSRLYTRPVPGSKLSFVQVDPGTGLRSDMAAKAVKGLMHGITDGHSDEFVKDPKYFDAFKGNEQVARGTILTVQGNDGPTKDGSKMITYFDWGLKQPSEALIEMMNEMLHSEAG